MTFGESLMKLRTEKSITRKEFAAWLQIPYTTLRNYETDQREPGHKTLIKMATLLGVSVDTLVGHQVQSNADSSLSAEALKLAQDYDTILDEWGKKQVRDVVNNEVARCHDVYAPSPDTDEDNVIRFPMPFYLQPSSAGFGDWADSEYAEKVMLVKEPPFGAAFIIPVNGDSMEPTYPDGCKVFVRPQHEVREGQVGIFYMDGKLWIKELGSDALISYNPDYPPQPFQEDLRCWGLVVGICDDSYFEH